MALRDYVICGECKTKIIYDGHDNGRDRLEEVWGDPNADVWTVHLLCPDCIKKLHADLAAARARIAELEHTNSAKVDQAERERDAYRDAMAKINDPAIALAAMLPPPPIIMPAQDWELHQQIQTLNERIAYLEPIFIAARNLVDNAEEYECDGLGLFAQHGWWEPLHDALDPDGSAAADDIRQPVAPAK